MLTGTFCHLPGVGATTEQMLWAAGFLSWDAALSCEVASKECPVQRSWLPHLRLSKARYDDRDIDYFAANLPTSQHWRMFPDFRKDCAFLDIETTGFSRYTQEITTIVLYDGQIIRYYVNGENLADFIEEIKAYRLLVTFNGKSFDVPFIETYFGVKLSHAHIDLLHVLRGVGVAGGQKACERQLGIRRLKSVEIDGFMAVLLWRQYRRTGDRRFLDTLLAYNIEDSVNLESLMVLAFNRNVKHTPFAHLRLAAPPRRTSPFKAHPVAVAAVTCG